MSDGEMGVGVIGLGHVGLPTALGLAELGWRVYGVDDDEAKARMIAGGAPPFHEPGIGALLRRHLESGRFSLETSARSATEKCDILIICVGTPQREDGSADLSYIERAGMEIAQALDSRKLIVEKSTTPVGTARRLAQSIRAYQKSAARGGKLAAAEFDIAVNPEFLREGSALIDFFHPDRIVIGADGERAKRLLAKLYAPLFERGDCGKTAEDTLVFTDIDTAELIKHASNAFLAMKVSFVNMVSDLCEATGADIADVADGIGRDPRIGREFLRAGIGFGGYCLPKDIRAFVNAASENGADFSLLREVERINAARVDRFVEKVRRAMWTTRGKTIAVWGLAFKPRTDDIRDAPSIAIVERLREEGALLRLHDPQAMEQFRRRFPEDPPCLTYAESAESAARGADAIALLTEWREYADVDWERLRDEMRMPVVIDGRNALDPAAMRRMGFTYAGVGRP